LLRLVCDTAALGEIRELGQCQDAPDGFNVVVKAPEDWRSPRRFALAMKGEFRVCGAYA
jgi:hypothetical protein